MLWIAENELPLRKFESLTEFLTLLDTPGFNKNMGHLSVNSAWEIIELIDVAILKEDSKIIREAEAQCVP